MTDPVDIQSLSGKYGPMLEALQEALEAEIGPLAWTPRSDASQVRRRGGSRAVRVSAINAIGVRTYALDPQELTRTVNQVLARFGFPEQPPMTGSPSGHLVCESTDPDGGEFTLLVKMTVDAWVDVPS